MIRIKNWSGRNSNNILQVAHAISFALKFNHNEIICPPHEYLLTNKIDNIPNKLVVENTFGGKFAKDLELRDISFDRKLLNRFYKRKIDDKITHQDELVIHIRSGDVFSKNPHRGWVQPPFCFYKEVIDSRNWKSIYIICEDEKSPILSKILKYNEKIIFKIQNLDEDISYILGAKNICFGFGTFVPALLLMNNCVQELFYPEYCFRYPLNILEKNIKHNTYKLFDYIKVGDWANTEKQRKIMLDFDKIKKS